MAICRRMKKAREYRGLLEEDVANKLGITEEQYREYENSEDAARSLTISQVLGISSLLGMSVDDLIGGAPLNTVDRIGNYKILYEDGRRNIYDRNDNYIGLVSLQWGRFRVGSWLQGYEAGRNLENGGEDFSGFNSNEL